VNKTICKLHFKAEKKEEKWMENQSETDTGRGKHINRKTDRFEDR